MTFYIFSLFFLLFFVFSPCLINSVHVQDPEIIAQEVQEKIYNASLSKKHNKHKSEGNLPCLKTGNLIDDCWRCDPQWDQRRQRLADCAIGFGKGAIGGRDGNIYVVTNTEDDPINPQPGTLRYGVIQVEPLWIVFSGDMNFKLKQELMINSYKTIDGRGANVHIANGPCITIQHVTNIIIHGINIHDCKRGGFAKVRNSPTHFGFRHDSDGDGVSILNGTNIWVDHCTFSHCTDGLIDAIHGSTLITISNNYMTHHDKVMLLGHDDSFTKDKNMQVTIAFNHFGEGLVQRIPRCRLGYFHVVNNDYTRWEMYAIGGSGEPTILSQGNRFLASNNQSDKEVTKRENTAQKEWRKWNWRSEGDLMLNGAYFVPSGSETSRPFDLIKAMPSFMVESITKDAGSLICKIGSPC